MNVVCAVCVRPTDIAVRCKLGAVQQSSADCAWKLCDVLYCSILFRRNLLTHKNFLTTVSQSLRCLFAVSSAKSTFFDLLGKLFCHAKLARGFRLSVCCRLVWSLQHQATTNLRHIDRSK